MAIEIDRAIPLPNRPWEVRRAIRAMQVGESVLDPKGGLPHPGRRRRQWHREAKRAKRGVTIKVVEGGFRVWRVR